MTQFITSREAVDMIQSGATVAVSGHSGFGTPDGLFKALHDRYIETAEPKDLRLMKVAGTGDGGQRGGDRLALPGLIKTIITSHLGFEPKLAANIEDNRYLAYLIPAGTIIDIYRALTAGRKAVWTQIGLHTLADPRVEGSKANDRTKRDGEDIVSLVTIDGEEYLQYHTFPIDVCLIRGSLADEDGNISLHREAMIGEQLEIATATHNSGGIVIIQVEDIVPRGTLDPRYVKIPHFLVDYVVVPRPKYHVQSFSCHGYRPELTGDARVKIMNHQSISPLDNRKIIARRAVLDIQPGDLVNLGVGIPEIVGTVAGEEGLHHLFTLANDSGIIGGVPLSGMDMGAAINPEAEMKLADMMDIYHGGGLDVCALGMAEIDADGNVNVSKFNGRVIGPGGFIDLAQKAKKIILMGTFTAGRLREHCEDGKLIIDREGQFCKFKGRVEQITFSGAYAASQGQDVWIMTERAVFHLEPEGLTLKEIAPGVDLEKDILAHMEFKPRIAYTLHLMDERIFRSDLMQKQHTV